MLLSSLGRTSAVPATQLASPTALPQTALQELPVGTAVVASAAVPATQNPTPVPVIEATAIPPLATAVVDPSAALQAQVDQSWAKGDWSNAVNQLQQLRKLQPDAVELADKLYVAHFSWGKSLLDGGDARGAAGQFAQAVDLNPGRGEAQAELLALTPTPTAVPLTATPVAPAATATPAIPANVTAYVSYMAVPWDQAQQSLTDLSSLSSQAGARPSVASTRAWLSQSASALAKLKSAGQTMQGYSGVPAQLKKLDGLFVSYGKDLVYISGEYAAGVDTQNATRLDNASTRMISATRTSQQITDELVRIGTQYGLDMSSV